MVLTDMTERASSFRFQRQSRRQARTWANEPKRSSRRNHNQMCLLSCDPFQRFALLAFVIDSHFGMHEQPNCAYDPMLPVMPSDNGYALHFPVVIFHESNMPFEGRDVLPARKIRGINQQSDFALLPDERIDLRRKLLKIVSLYFFGYCNFQCAAEIGSIVII